MTHVITRLGNHQATCAHEAGIISSPSAVARSLAQVPPVTSLLVQRIISPLFGLFILPLPPSTARPSLFTYFSSLPPPLSRPPLTALTPVSRRLLLTREDVQVTLTPACGSDEGTPTIVWSSSARQITVRNEGCADMARISTSLADEGIAADVYPLLEVRFK